MPTPLRTLAPVFFAFAVSSVLIAQAPPAPSAPDPSTLPGATQPAAATKAPDSQPSVVVVLDSSAGPASFSQMKDAASQFIRSMGEERDVAVVAASEKPALVADFNTDSDDLLKRLSAIKSHGKPAIDRAVATGERIRIPADAESH